MLPKTNTYLSMNNDKKTIIISANAHACCYQGTNQATAAIAKQKTQVGELPIPVR